MNGWNFLHDNNQLFEDAEVDYHGTHIAGIIGAVGNNKIGTTGVTWRVSLMALKVLDGHGNKGLTANSVKAINYVISQKRAGANIRVINASWVSEGESRAVRDAIEAAGRAGIVFICAAGNDAKNLDQDPIYPAARSAELDCLISVAASDRFDNLQPFSNYGRKTISVAAPGTDILGLGVGDHYCRAQWDIDGYGARIGHSRVNGSSRPGVYSRPDQAPDNINRRAHRRSFGLLCRRRTSARLQCSDKHNSSH